MGTAPVNHAKRRKVESLMDALRPHEPVSEAPEAGLQEAHRQALEGLSAHIPKVIASQNAVIDPAAKKDNPGRSGAQWSDDPATARDQRSTAYSRDKTWRDGLDSKTAANMAGIRSTVAGMESDQDAREAAPPPVIGFDRSGEIVENPGVGGKIYYGGGPGVLDEKTEQRIADMGQPGLAHGPYNDPRTSQRWANLRASMPQRDTDTSAPPLRQEMIDDNKIRAGTTHISAAPMTPDELRASASPEAKRIHAAGAANLAAGEAARPNVGHNAQVEAMMRRSRLNGSPIAPVMANLFVGAGLGRPQATTQVNDSVANAGTPAAATGAPPMNPAMMALFPDLAKTQMQTSAASDMAREKNSVDMQRMENDNSRANAEMVMKSAQAKVAQLQQLHTAAKTFEEKSYYEAEIRRVEQEGMQAVAALQNMPQGVRDFFGSTPKPYEAPVATGVPVSNGAVPGGGPKVWNTSTPSGRAGQQQSQLPTDSQVNDVLGQPRSYMDDIMGAPIPPTARPAPGEQGTQRAQDWKQQEQAVATQMEPARQAVVAADLPGIDATYNTPQRAHMIYKAVRQANPALPDNVIRRAIAEHLKDSRIIDGTWDWDKLMKEYSPKEPYFINDVLPGEVGGF